MIQERVKTSTIKGIPDDTRGKEPTCHCGRLKGDIREAGSIPGLGPYGLCPSKLLCPWDSPVRILESVAMPSSGDLPTQGSNPHFLCLLHWQAGSLPLVPPKKPEYSVHGILQARILGWVAISFSRGSSQPRDRTQVSCIAGSFFTN